MAGHAGPTEIAHVHADMLELKGEQRLLSQRLDSSIQAMTGSLQALQADVRGVQDKLDQLTHAQSEFTHHSTAVDRLAKVIEKLIADNERRWETHERENKSVADNVNRHSTGIKVGWIAACVLAIVLGWYGNSQYARVRERMDDHLAAGNDMKRTYEQRFQRMESDVKELRDQMGKVKAP